MGTTIQASKRIFNRLFLELRAFEWSSLGGMGGERQSPNRSDTDSPGLIHLTTSA